MCTKRKVKRKKVAEQFASRRCVTVFFSLALTRSERIQQEMLFSYAFAYTASNKIYNKYIYTYIYIQEKIHMYVCKRNA